MSAKRCEYSSYFMLDQARDSPSMLEGAPVRCDQLFPALRMKPAINPRLACFPLALFVWVHSARYVKRLASIVPMVAVLKGAQGPISTPICPILRRLVVQQHL
jgi:hypothetical protein